MDPVHLSASAGWRHEPSQVIDLPAALDGAIDIRSHGDVPTRSPGHRPHGTLQLANQVLPEEARRACNEDRLQGRLRGRSRIAHLRSTAMRRKPGFGLVATGSPTASSIGKSEVSSE